MPTSFSEKNNASRERLVRLVDGISEQDLKKETSAGWTVSAILAHLAFWDQRALVLLRRWKQDGVNPSPVDPDAINDAVKMICLAIPPRKAVELCLSAAKSIDAEIEQLSAETIKEIEAKSTNFRLNRGTHRNEHIDELDAILLIK